MTSEQIIRKQLTEEEKILLQTFTAFNNNLAENEIDRHSIEKIETCVEQIKLAINDYKKFYIYKLVEDEKQQQSIYSYLKNKLGFIIVKNNDELKISWSFDEIKTLSETELKEKGEKIGKWSVYHATLQEKEVKKEFIKNVVDELLLACIKNIQALNIEEKYLCFAIPYFNYSFLEKDDRYIIFDRLVSELEHRNFKMADVNKIYGRMRITGFRHSKGSVEFLNTASCSTDKKESIINDDNTDYDYKKILKNKDDAAKAINKLSNLISRRTKNLVHASLTKNSNSTDYFVKQNSEIEINITQIIHSILSHFDGI
jgi:hypothetical protein